MHFLSYIECKLPDSITQQQQRFSTSIFHDLPNIDVKSGDKMEIFVKNPCHFGSSFPAKALDPKHAAVLSGRGACVLKLGRHDEASSGHKHLCPSSHNHGRWEIGPSNISFRFHLGWFSTKPRLWEKGCNILFDSAMLLGCSQLVQSRLKTKRLWFPKPKCFPSVRST